MASILWQVVILMLAVLVVWYLRNVIGTGTESLTHGKSALLWFPLLYMDKLGVYHPDLYHLDFEQVILGIKTDLTGRISNDYTL